MSTPMIAPQARESGFISSTPASWPSMMFVFPSLPMGLDIDDFKDYEGRATFGHNAVPGSSDTDKNGIYLLHLSGL